MKRLLTYALMIAGLAGTAHAKDVVIGAILPLSGASATQGEDQRRGMELALEKINASGGVLGGTLKIVTEDSAGRAPTALDAAKKLVTVDNVPVVIGEFSSGITIPIAEYLAQQNRVHFNIGSTSTDLRKIKGPFYSVIGLDDVSGAFSAQDVIDRGAKKVAIIAPNNAYGQGVVDAFGNKFKELGGTIAGTVMYTEGQTSYRRELQQLEKSAPDMYVYTAYGKESATINRESFELGLSDTPWYAIYLTMCTADSDAQYIEGQLGMDLNYVGPAGADYESTYKGKFGGSFLTTFNGFAYDAVMLTAAAINKAQSDDPRAISKAVTELGKKYEGVTGEIVFDSEHPRMSQPYLKLKIADGKVASN